MAVKRKSSYVYRCPKCGSEGGSDQAPSAQPWCWNDEEHHSPKGWLMLFVPSRSKRKEPKYKHKTMPSDLKDSKEEEARR